MKAPRRHRNHKKRNTMNTKQTTNKTTQTIFAILVGIVLLSPSLRAADSPPPSAAAATEHLVCNRVRILPREGFPQRIKGAVIQGSNTGPTADFVDLATVAEEGREGEWTELKFANSKVYRFLRYFGPKDSWCNVAELEFYHDDTKLRGSSFGTYGSRDNGKNTYDKAFDGDPKTFFDAFEPNDQ